MAVESFLDRRLPFLGISRLIEATLAALPASPRVAWPTCWPPMPGAPDCRKPGHGSRRYVSEIPFYLLAFVVVLGVLIVVPEFGHYVAARWCGVRVLRFSVGFGHALWQRRLGKDGTEWAIGIFPLGGYVKMLDEREGEVAPMNASAPSIVSRWVSGA